MESKIAVSDLVNTGRGTLFGSSYQEVQEIKGLKNGVLLWILLEQADH